MAARFGLLGWRNPRPNDFQGPDQRPLRDQFSNLQQLLTWPHFGATIDVQTFGNALAKKTITPYDDPYSLIRTNDDIQVPQDFYTWMFLGVAQTRVSVAGPARGILSWHINGVEVVGDENWTPAGAVDIRLSAVCLQPVKRGDIIDIRGYGTPDSTVVVGDCWGYFLPLV